MRVTFALMLTVNEQLETGI